VASSSVKGQFFQPVGQGKGFWFSRVMEGADKRSPADPDAKYRGQILTLSAIHISTRWKTDRPAGFTPIFSSA